MTKQMRTICGTTAAAQTSLWHGKHPLSRTKTTRKHFISPWWRWERKQNRKCASKHNTSEHGTVACESPRIFPHVPCARDNNPSSMNFIHHSSGSNEAAIRNGVLIEFNLAINHIWIESFALHRVSAAFCTETRCQTRDKAQIAGWRHLKNKWIMHRNPPVSRIFVACELWNEEGNSIRGT